MSCDCLYSGSLPQCAMVWSALPGHTYFPVVTLAWTLRVQHTVAAFLSRRFCCWLFIVAPIVSAGFVLAWVLVLLCSILVLSSFAIISLVKRGSVVLHWLFLGDVWLFTSDLCLFLMMPLIGMQFVVLDDHTHLFLIIRNYFFHFCDKLKCIIWHHKRESRGQPFPSRWPPGINKQMRTKT